jgi:uncharacterized protein YfiM (DUF2279 family)
LRWQDEKQMKSSRNRIFVSILLFFIFILAANKNASAADDKLLHFGVSSLFGAASESYLHYKTNLKTPGRLIWGTTLGSIPGLAKEIIDSTKKDNHFSGGDMAADIGGAFVGALVANIFNNAIQVKIEKKEQEKMVVFSISYEF